MHLLIDSRSPRGCLKIPHPTQPGHEVSLAVEPLNVAEFDPVVHNCWLAYRLTRSSLALYDGDRFTTGLSYPSPENLLRMLASFLGYDLVKQS